MTAQPQSGWQDCPVCKGEGWTFEPEHQCARCHGTGKVTARYAAELQKVNDLRPALSLVGPANGPVPGETPSLPCADCGQPYQMYAGALLLPPHLRAGFLRCEPCQQAFTEQAGAEEFAKRRGDWQAKTARWWERSGVPLRFQSARFATFHRESNGPAVADAYDAAREWADAWDWRRPDALPGLLLFAGMKGTGKTHLLTAMCWRVLERCQPDDEALWKLVREREYHRTGGPAANPLRFWQADQLLLHIAQSRRPVRFDENAPPRETEEEIYAALAQYRLLAIDDLGQAPSITDGQRQTAVWEKVINDRYNANLPIIATTNLTVKELRAVVGDRGASRLQEMCDFVEVNGLADYRRMRAEQRGQ